MRPLALKPLLNMILAILLSGVLSIAAGCQKLTDVGFPPPVSPTTSETPVDLTSTPVPEVAEQPIFSANGAVYDPLTEGSSRYNANIGGSFIVGQGFLVTENTGEYLQYSTNIYGNIRLEFDATGYFPGEDGGSGKYRIFQIYDTPHEVSWLGGSSYPWETNSLFELRKRGGGQGEYTDNLQIKFGGRGNWDELRFIPASWESYVTYHWIITAQNGRITVVRNNETLYDISNAYIFAPEYALNVRIGGCHYESGPRNIIYSNVQISGM